MFYQTFHIALHLYGEPMNTGQVEFCILLMKQSSDLTIKTLIYHFIYIQVLKYMAAITDCGGYTVLITSL